MCLTGLRNLEDPLLDAIEWYQKMVDKYPGRYQLLMGFANALSNNGDYDYSIDLYTSII